MPKWYALILHLAWLSFSLLQDVYYNITLGNRQDLKTLGCAHFFEIYVPILANTNVPTWNSYGLFICIGLPDLQKQGEHPNEF